MDDRGFERVVMQDCRIDETCELGFAPHDLFRLAADARPNRVHLFQRMCGFHLVLGHDLFTPGTCPTAAVLA